MTRKTVIALVVTVLAGAATRSGAADELYVYPAKGQSPEKQARDQEECHEWAVKQTGVDPAKLAETAPESQTSEGSGLMKGMAGGAGVGALRGAADGEAGAGAAHGVGMAGVVGMIRARRKMQQEHEQHMQAHEDQETQLGKYDRAYTACLVGRGYTVQ